MRTAIIPCRYTPPIFEFSEEILDLVSGFIERFIIGYKNLSVPSGRNACGYPAFLQSRTKIITFVSLICDEDICSWHSCKHPASADVIV